MYPPISVNVSLIKSPISPRSIPNSSKISLTTTKAPITSPIGPRNLVITLPTLLNILPTNCKGFNRVLNIPPTGPSMFDIIPVIPAPAPPAAPPAALATPPAAPPNGNLVSFPVAASNALPNGPVFNACA